MTSAPLERTQILTTASGANWKESVMSILHDYIQRLPVIIWEGVKLLHKSLCAIVLR